MDNTLHYHTTQDAIDQSKEDYKSITITTSTGYSLSGSMDCKDFITFNKAELFLFGIFDVVSLCYCFIRDKLQALVNKLTNRIEYTLNL